MLIPIAIIFVAIAVGIFFWAVKSDQFEDLEREGSNILFDDEGNNETPLNQHRNSHNDSHSKTHDN